MQYIYIDILIQGDGHQSNHSDLYMVIMFLRIYIWSSMHA